MRKEKREITICGQQLINFYTVGYYIHTKLGIFQAQQRGFRSESRSYIDSSVPDKEPIWGGRGAVLIINESGSTTSVSQ